MPGLATADLLSSLHALSGVVMALFRREKTGRGDRLDVSMQHAALAGLPNVMGPAMAGRQQPDPHDARNTGGSAVSPISDPAARPPLELGGPGIIPAERGGGRGCVSTSRAGWGTET